jgi:tRNA_anti-like
MKKSFVIIPVLLLLAAVWIFFRMYNKPHRDPSSESSIQITATELFNKYENNEAEANGLYLDKALTVTGKITELTANQEMKPVLTLETENPMFGIRCTMEDPTINVQVGDSVSIKGICSGYLSDVIIIKATVVE